MIKRRSLIAGIVSMPAAGWAGASKPLSLAQPLTGAIRKRLSAVPRGPALLASYPDAAANADFPEFAPANDTAAYTYDNALAGLALLAAGHALEAARIADAFVAAQAHDPDFRDGRLRNAYRAGPVTPPIALPGWWDAEAKLWAEDPYQVGSEAGPIAWAILLWTALREAGVNGARYDAAARRAAGWIVAHCHDKNGFSGGYFGFPPHPQKLLWLSTEQNTDLAIGFARLGMHADAARAAGFVRSMLDPATGLFAAGLTPDGARNGLLAADANLWPYLAGLADGSVIAPALRALGWPHAHPAGIGFSAASRGIWTEGTAFAALSLRRAGRTREAARFLATLGHQGAPDGYLFTTDQQRLATGLTIGPGANSPKFAYYRVPALAPTAWSALAALGINPLRR
ncbi:MULTISPECIES: hypothetical protein [Acidiphilium]|uniref:Methylaspartate ammonia-lyase n=1 Tax=Acidiphilium iwatense TaxID=768198 RepID=A0ABS9DX17_9PROT|nr:MULTISPECIES: hypothetical protein [Acidiphilium]MCF3947281.1 hypothetical protein [Acidiphilium iwatense]